MVRSAHDAEDALQEALVDAWCGLAKFEGRASLRSWLYLIATNASLDTIKKRSDRVLPIDYSPPADLHGRARESLAGSTAMDPDPAQALEIEDRGGTPEARAEQREAIELALIAASQLLPAKQRAALMLREALGFSARETADALDTTVASVNSALQRARATIDERPPELNQQGTLRTLRPEGVREVVERYVDAWDKDDVETIVSMLADEAGWSTPASRIPPVATE